MTCDLPSDFAAEGKRLLDPDHDKHEDIIGYLQNYPDPASVPYLKSAIALKPALAYLDYDDYGAYYKKCLWALQAIGTEEALAVIRECASSNDQALRTQALHRLDRIAQKRGTADTP